MGVRGQRAPSMSNSICTSPNAVFPKRIMHPSTRAVSPCLTQPYGSINMRLWCLLYINSASPRRKSCACTLRDTYVSSKTGLRPDRTHSRSMFTMSPSRIGMCVTLCTRVTTRFMANYRVGTTSKGISCGCCTKQKERYSRWHHLLHFRFTMQSESSTIFYKPQPMLLSVTTATESSTTE